MLEQSEAKSGGRLLECIATDWQAILREKEEPGEGCGHYRMLLARIQGNLRIVR